MNDIDSNKARAREAARAARSRLPEGVRRQAADALAGHAERIAGLARGGVVSAFASFGDELDTAKLIAALDRLGTALALPVVGRRGHPLTFRRWRPGDPTAPGPFGIAQPLPEAPRALPDVFLVPLLAFDRRGYRLGYGGGFYDRTLAEARAQRPVLALGLAFACQEAAEVPIDPHDQPLDAVLTEAGMIRCGEGRNATALSG